MTGRTVTRRAGIEFLHVTSDSVHVRGLVWFEDHWSREASWGRGRSRPPEDLLLLLPGTERPAVFAVRGGEVLGTAHAGGRRFTRRTAELVTAAAGKAPVSHPFRYWEADPADGEAPVEDVETAALPTG